MMPLRSTTALNIGLRLRGGAVASSAILCWFCAACGAFDDGADARRYPEPISEEAEVELPDPETSGAGIASVRQAWSELSHVSIAELAAEKWGLDTSRAEMIGDAADDPDEYESGIENGFNQQWSHAYLYSAFGSWMWGDANENFDDCISGSLSGQLEGPECRDGESAALHYASGDQRRGDAFLGYAIHYIEDVSLVLHSSEPTLAPDLLLYHSRFEDWVKSNWTAGHDFQATVAADYYYYPITDLQQAVRNAAWASSYWNSSSAGRKAWNAYRSSGYPSGAGTGNAALVESTKQMLIRASRYATGTIACAFDRYDQWNTAY